MGELTVVRLYLSAQQMPHADTGWKKLAPQSLGEFCYAEPKQVASNKHTYIV